MLQNKRLFILEH